MLSESDVIKPYRTKAQISASLSLFTKLAKRVVVLGHTPGIYPFAYCLSGSTDISRCIRLLTRSYQRATVYEKVLATRAGAEFVDTSEWFCVRVGGGRTACPAVIGNVPVFRDGAHVTSAMELKLIPLIRAVLKSTG